MGFNLKNAWKKVESFGKDVSGSTAAKEQRLAAEQNRALYQPYYDFGLKALGDLESQKGLYAAPSWDEEYTSRLDDYTSSPAYQAQNALAQEELQRQLMARGLNYGATGASAGAKLNQQLVASDYDKYRSELANRYNALRGERSDAYSKIMDRLNVGNMGLGGMTGQNTAIGNARAQQSMGTSNLIGLGLQGVGAYMSGGASMAGAGLANAQADYYRSQTPTTGLWG